MSTCPPPAPAFIRIRHASRCPLCSDGYFTVCRYVLRRPTSCRPDAPRTRVHYDCCHAESPAPAAKVARRRRHARTRSFAPRPDALSVAATARLPAEVLKLLTFSFFAKQFKLYGQLTERK